MSIRQLVRRKSPNFVKQFIRARRLRRIDKYEEELSFWRSRHEIDKGRFQNVHFEKIMLAMSEETGDDFL